MQMVGGSLQLSASDLVGQLNCRYLTALDRDVATGDLAKPVVWDPLLEVLAERGARHEQGYIDQLKASGYEVTTVEGVGIDSIAVAHTLEAMRSGAQIIAQGPYKQII
jgi:hypothetical protein